MTAALADKKPERVDPLRGERVARLWTPERVPLTVPLAGMGERALAYIIDLAVLGAAFLASAFVYNFWGDLEADLGALGGLGALLLGLGIFAGVVLYDTLFEVLGDGRTPGKRALKLRVVTAGGRSPDAITSLLRNALRLVDFLPFFYAVGTVSLFLTGTRRLGDLVADTFVVTERARASDPLAACRAAAGDAPLPPPPAWRDEDVARALEVVERTARYGPEAAAPACAKALKRIDPALAAATKPVDARATLARACLALADARAGLAADVKRLEQTASELREALLAPLRDEGAVLRLDERIRRGASDLMRATRRDLPPRMLEPLSLLLLDAERRRTLRAPAGVALRRFFAEDLPRTVYDERRLVLRAAVVLAGALVLGGAVAFADAALGRALVGDDLAERIEAGADWTDRIDEQKLYASVALQVILNNVLVGLRVFAFGLLGGVGSILGLLTNGVGLGAVYGYALRMDTADTLGRFVLAHAPTELGAICVAGAAGMCLGRALVSPGARTRLVALREEGARGGRLMIAAALGFVVTGTVEGFVSPGRLFPPAVNATIGLLVLGLFVAWVALYGRRRVTAGPAP